MDNKTEKKMARWVNQRWVLDNIIRMVGPEWDQGRLTFATSVIGAGLIHEAEGIRNSVKKFNDIHREFEKAARRRKIRAEEAESNGNYVSARESYLAASVLYGYASWPFFEDDNPKLMELNSLKNECYDKYIEYADHLVKRVDVPFENTSLPGFVHYPPGWNGEQKLPFVLSIGGMDGFKETRVSLYGDKFLSRGFGVITVDGPGQGESLIARKIRFVDNNFDNVGKACMDFLQTVKGVDVESVSAYGTSMSSYWIPRLLAKEPRFKSGAVAFVCHEPHHFTLFNGASPSFKLRFMWMAGIDDEDEFDKYAESLTLEGIGEKIKCPFLIAGGENDDLSPFQYSYNLYNSLTVSGTLHVYEGDRHFITNPFWLERIADWVKERTDGKPLSSGISYFLKDGKVELNWTPH